MCVCVCVQLLAPESLFLVCECGCGGGFVSLSRASAEQTWRPSFLFVSIFFQWVSACPLVLSIRTLYLYCSYAAMQPEP